MTSIENTWKHIILRVIVVSGVGILVGLTLYRSSVFVPTRWAFQFTVSSISAGLAYAFLKSPLRRHLLPALFIWYVILTGLLLRLTWRSLILDLAYIGGVAFVILIYNYGTTKPYLNNVVLRIIYSGAIMTIVNCVIVICLALFSLNSVLSHVSVFLSSIKLNAEIGVIIGLAVGAGIEISEYIIGKLSEYEIVHPGENEVAHKTS